FLHLAHFRGEGWLITHRRRHATKQCRDFRTCLRKPEDVVDEEQHVQALVAKILSDCQAGKSYPQTRPGGVGYLAVDKRHLRLPQGVHVDLGHVEFAGVMEVLIKLFPKLNYLRLDHLAQNIVSFTSYF